MTRIVLADDHKIVLDGLSSLLAGYPEFDVVGRASDGFEAVRLAETLRPDVMILDIGMPGLNGVETTRRILERWPRTRVIILSMHAEGRFILESLKAGAAGYLLKESAFEELIAAVRTVRSGQSYLSTAITATVIRDYVRHLQGSDTTAFSVLSVREREVLQLFAEGAVTKEIASKLGVSVKTIETYRKNIMDKLDIRSIAELTKYAIREGITNL
jgi:DNA-binding NarL/FixJ family response regulator